MVDFYHAAQQLKAELDAAYGESSAKGQAQFSKLRHVLLEEDDGVERVIRALAYLRTKHRRKKRIGEVLGYFRRHRKRMHYAELKALEVLSLLDRTTMAASIEGRVPFLDHRVAELAMAIHGRHKYGGRDRSTRFVATRELAQTTQRQRGR